MKAEQKFFIFSKFRDSANVYYPIKLSTFQKHLLKKKEHESIVFSFLLI